MLPLIHVQCYSVIDDILCRRRLLRRAAWQRFRRGRSRRADQRTLITGLSQYARYYRINLQYAARLYEPGRWEQ